MQFLTIGQYFYKLYNAVLLILLVPIVAFIMVYFQVSGALAPAQQSYALLITLALIVLLAWIVIFIFFNKKIKPIRTGQGLRIKLEKYFYLTIVRYLILSIGCMVLAFGFHQTADDLFTGMFVLNLVLAGVLWPTAAKTSKDLKLRGDEREMVFYKKDTL